MPHSVTRQQSFIVRNGIISLFLFAACVLAACTNADYDTGVKLALNHEYKKAYDKFLAAANNGYAQAMLQVGNYLAAGRGVSKDSDKAEDWYLKAYAAGDDKAVPALGKLYLDQKRYSDALRFLHKGLQTRDGRTIYLLARCYEEGWGTPVNRKKAIKYYLLAANLEYSRADYRLHELGVDTWDTSSANLPVHTFFLLEHPTAWFILFFLNILILPVYIKLFFDDWQDFGYHLRQLFIRPGLEKRMEMASRGESLDDGFDRLKTVAWFIFYLAAVTGQYKLLLYLFY